MDSVGKALREQLSKLPAHFLQKIIVRKLKDAKVDNPEVVAPKLVAHILAGNDGTLTLDDDKPGDAVVGIEITEADMAEMKSGIAEFTTNELPELIKTIAATSGADFAKALKKDWPRQGEWQDASIAGFLYNLDARWGKAIDLLRMLLTISREIGQARTKRLTRRKAIKNPALTDVLFRLHARSCQVAEEIVTLLQNGFADGAMARWRTLYEIGVVAAVLGEHGEEMARRYVDHEVVEARAAMDEYDRRMVPLGEPPYPAREKKKILKGFDQTVAKYGKSFASSYGWAAHHLKKPKPIFPDLEIAAQRSQTRPYYRMASYNVHAGPKGIFTRLGSLDSPSTIIAGRSNAGLTDPGAHTANTLALMTFLLFGPKYSLSDTIQMQAIAELSREAVEAFARAGRRLKRDHRAVGRKSRVVL
jgi:hypothetical protein